MDKNKPDIVCISTIDWDFLRQRHQIFMEMFAAQGYRVIYIENINPAALFDSTFLPKIFKRIVRVFINFRKNSHTSIPGLVILTPIVIPFHNRFSDFLNRNFFLKLHAYYIKKFLKVEKSVVWTYLATTNTMKFIDYLKPQAVIYDCVLDALTHPLSPLDIELSEKSLIDSADIIFTDNIFIYKKCSKMNKDTYLIRPGVESRFFISADRVTQYKFFKEVIGPRICFFGGIDQIRLDLGLISYLAKQRPDWNIILLGPVIKTDITILNMKNIIIKGTVNHDELPSYLAETDVLILPYKIIPFSRSIFPAKIFECFASGKPIVATALDELNYFKDEVIAFAKTKEDFLKAVEKALKTDSKETKQIRQNIAQENLWENRFEELLKILNKRLKFSL